MYNISSVYIHKNQFIKLRQNHLKVFKYYKKGIFFQLKKKILKLKIIKI